MYNIGIKRLITDQPCSLLNVLQTDPVLGIAEGLGSLGRFPLKGAPRSGPSTKLRRICRREVRLPSVYSLLNLVGFRVTGGIVIQIMQTSVYL